MLDDNDIVFELIKKYKKLSFSIFLVLFSILVSAAHISSGHSTFDSIIVIVLEVLSTSFAVIITGVLFSSLNNMYNKIDRSTENTKLILPIMKAIEDNGKWQREAFDILNVNNDQHPLLLKKYGGITQIGKGFDKNRFVELNSNSKNMYILNVWLPDWAFMSLTILRKLKERRNAHVYILLASQDCEYAVARDKSLEHNVPEKIKETHELISILYNKLNSDQKKRLHFRVFSCAPSCSFYATDDVAIMGLFGVSHLAIDGVAIEFSKNTTFGRSVWPEFDDLWDHFTTEKVF